VLSLASYRCVRDAAGVSVLIEPLRTEDGGFDAGEAPAQRPAEPFRTGLSDLDLGLTPDEQREFERLASPRGASG
jgi:hypothetical protein